MNEDAYMNTYDTDPYEDAVMFDEDLPEPCQGCDPSYTRCCDCCYGHLLFDI